MGKSFTDSEIDYIKTWYGKKTAIEIGEDLGRTIESVYHKAKRLNLQTRKIANVENAKNPWSKEEEQFLLDNYETMLGQEIENKLGRSQDAVHLRAAKLGLSKGYEAQCLAKSYGGNKINHKYFEQWSNSMAYILGLIYADGCLFNYRTTIALKSSDAYLLENIRNILESDNEVTIKDKVATLHFSSKTIRESLESYGLTQNKSLTIQMPEVLKEYLPHFIRGVFDGDGTITHNKARPRIAFYSGSKKFLEQLDSIISNYLQIEPGLILKPEREKNTYSVYYGSINALDLGQWMYQDADLKLERKYERWINHEQKWRDRYNEVIEALANGKRLKGVTDKVAKSYKRYYSNSPFWPRGIYRKPY